MTDATAKTIDSFLDHQEPCASFHDARLICLQINYEQRELVSDWLLCIGNPEAPDETDRERTRRGRLRLSGLSFWVVESDRQIIDGTTPWLTSDGPLSGAGTPLSKALFQQLPPDVMAWYLYFSNWKAFAYCSAESGAFEWME